jgi:glycosyltransferase involved in cell wall biosynthesis
VDDVFSNIKELMQDVRKKRVCVFTIHPAKNFRVLNRQCRSLQKYGWDVTLIAISEEGNYDDDGIKVIGIRKWKSGWGRVRTVLRIAYEAYKQKPDIYHFHDPDLLICAVFLRFLTRRPVIYDIHEFYNILVPRKLPSIFSIRRIASALVWFAETILGTLCGNISGVCEELVGRFSKLGCRTVQTPNFASIEDFVPVPVSDEEWEERRKRVIFIGTLAPLRGSLILLDVAKQLKERRPDIEFIAVRRFLAKYQEEAMEKKMALPGYQNVIRFIPNMSGGKEFAKVVRKAGIGLSPGTDVDLIPRGIPNKFFEYMSQAVPIVAADFPSSRKYIGNEGCGILVKPESLEEYIDAIIRLADNPELAKEMGRKGQRAFVEKYNWSIFEKRLLAFYDSIMKKQI